MFGYKPVVPPNAAHVAPVGQSVAKSVDGEECITLLQGAITNLDMYKHWSEEAFIHAARLSLHGEKRRERDIFSEKEYCLTKQLQSVALDVFDVEIRPEEKRLQFAEIGSFEDFFVTLKEKLWVEYHDLQSTANHLVMLGYDSIACPIRELCRCIWHTLIDVKRTIREGRVVGWMPHHIFVYQTGYNNAYGHIEKFIGASY